MKKILVTGSRNWLYDQARIIHRVLDECEEAYGRYHLIHGGCKGVDAMAGSYAFVREMIVTCVPAQWGIYGIKAGPIRNEYMLKHGKPSLVIAFHDKLASSKGTGHMVKTSREANIPVIVIASMKDAESVKDKLP
jgi:hypothetical protein